MGKVLSFLAGVKSAHDRKKQQKVLTNIAANKKISWQQPQQRRTVAEGAKAAQRLSVWDKEPDDEQDRKKYHEDLEKVDNAINVLKKNYNKENKNEIESAMKQAEKQQNDDSIEEKQIENNANNGTKDVKDIETESDSNSHEDAWPAEEDTQLEDKQIGNNNDANNVNITVHNEQHQEANNGIYSDSSDEDEPQVNELCDESDEEKEMQRRRKKKTSYSGMCIQIAIDKSQNVQNEAQLVLTNSHNFLWVTTAVQDGLNSIIEAIANEEENAEELTRVSLDTHLDSFPPSFRAKSWEICTAGEEMDVIWPEIYKVFVDSMLIATGQYDIDDDLTSLMFEIRDMTEVFEQIVKVKRIFNDKKNTAKWSKTTRCLSTGGARTLVKAARNIRGNRKLGTSDNMIIALLTGFTKQALENAVFFCTRVFWKLLTDTWWDNDDDDDVALPMSLAKYESVGTLNSGNLLSVTQRQGLGAMSMEVLFPDLVLFGNDDEDGDIDETFTQYLRVLE